MKDFFAKHWKMIAGAVCGAAAVGVGTVNPAAGLALGAVCGAAFGRDAAVVGQQVAELLKKLDDAASEKK